ncbi:MAG: hypothetical protein GX774_20905 [Armatimonadetes bacterium]|nr:hypothetical protein [Armatimonadota bacterium]
MSGSSVRREAGRSASGWRRPGDACSFASGARRGVFAAALVAALAFAAVPGANAREVPHTLVRATVAARPAGTPPVIFAATLNPYTVVRRFWGDRLVKISRGGFNAVHVSVPWSIGQEGGVKTDDLDAFLTEVKTRGMKAILGPPPDVPAGDWKAWLAAVLPVLQEHAEQILWLQAQGEGAAALTEAAQAAQCPVPVADGAATTVPGAADPNRPYREPATALALRNAIAEGATALVWDALFAGAAPPMMWSGDDTPVASMMEPGQGGLPVGYYEAHLFGQVLACLGAPLVEAKPVEGASSDAAAVQVSQRNAGNQGFLFVTAPADPLRAFNLTYVDPESNEKVTIPKTPGVALRTFGAGARILPLNLPVPGGVIRYSTAEVYGTYRLGKRTAILVADDEGAPNEIALKLETDQAPAVVGGLPTEPVWDAQTRTLTLAFAASFGDTLVAIGDDLLLGFIPTERAQRTWALHYNDLVFPLITSGYLLSEEKVIEDKLAFSLWTQQGKTAVVALLEKRPEYIAANRLGVKVTYDAKTCAYQFMLQTPTLSGAKLTVPAVQVLDRARFLATPGDTLTHLERAFDDKSWKEVRLDKPQGVGCYRVRFRLPAVANWIIPWKATLNLTGKASVYLNGAPLGVYTGVNGEFVEVGLPRTLLNAGTDGNVLAITLMEGTGIGKVGISPYMEHAVEHQAVVLWM